MFQTNFLSKSKHTFYVQKLFSENHVVYGIMLKNIVWTDSPQMKINMRIPCWIPKATDTNNMS